MTININVPELRELKPRILVLGVGGAGGNAINGMIEAGLQGVEFVAVNTDAQDLKMNKAELVEKIAKDADISKASAERVLNTSIDTIIKAVTKGDKVQLIGFGTFGSGKRAARVGRNPKTGEAIKIAAAKTVKFTAGKAFKDAVNKRK